MDVHKKECFYPVTTVNCLQSKSVLWLHWEATSFIVRSVISPTSQQKKLKLRVYMYMIQRRKLTICLLIMVGF